MQLPAAGGAGESAGQGEQRAPQGLGHDEFVAHAEPEGGDPTQQVVGERDEHQPGGVGEKAARGMVVEPAPCLASRMASSTTAWRR